MRPVAESFASASFAFCDDGERRACGGTFCAERTSACTGSAGPSARGLSGLRPAVTAPAAMLDAPRVTAI
eukprot:6190701-Pleurochrysis_carterae.AAC.2